MNSVLEKWILNTLKTVSSLTFQMVSAILHTKFEILETTLPDKQYFLNYFSVKKVKRLKSEGKKLSNESW